MHVLLSPYRLLAFRVLLLRLTFLPSCSSCFMLFHVVSPCFFFLSMASMLPRVAQQLASGKMTFQPAAAMPIIESARGQEDPKMQV